MNGVRFGDRHSYDDWGLLLKSRPEISPPKVKTLYYDIPEADGRMDMTEWATGEPKFDDRTLTCTFQVLHPREQWSDFCSQILDYLHGNTMQVILDEDPDYYYMGRFAVDSWQSDKRTSTLVIVGEVEPYKYELYKSTEDWVWDSFNFETGIIREYNDIRVDGTVEFIIPGRRMSVVPSFKVLSDSGNGLQVIYKGVTYDLSDGTNRIVNLILGSGENILTFSGKGTVTIDYVGGRL